METNTAQIDHDQFEVQRLGKKYRANGFSYKLVKRTETTAIYERLEQPPVWEVFKIRIKRAQIFPNGNSYPRREVKPRDEDFGYLAWCYMNKDKAMTKFEKITAEVSDAEIPNPPTPFC